MTTHKVQGSFIRRTFQGIVLGGVCLSLSGCWEPEGVTYHEPGEYKGAEDNLSVDTAALQERLEGQKDR